MISCISTLYSLPASLLEMCALNHQASEWGHLDHWAPVKMLDDCSYISDLRPDQLGQIKIVYVQIVRKKSFPQSFGDRCYVAIDNWCSQLSWETRILVQDLLIRWRNELSPEMCCLFAVSLYFWVTMEIFDQMLLKHLPWRADVRYPY